MWSIAEEIHFLSQLANVPCELWRHYIVGAKIASPSDDTPTSLLSFIPPANFTWIVTLASLRSIPPVADPSLTVGDWRSNDYDASGTAKMFWQVKKASVTSENATYFAVVNKPCLFAFKGGDQVDLVVQREAVPTPPNEVILIAVNSYITTPEAYDRLTANLTQIEATFS